MQNQEKIIQAIAAYLEENTIAVQDATVWHLQFKKEIDKLFLTKTAHALAAAIATHLEAGAGYPYSELFDHMANEHGLTLTNTELGDIIHVARCK